MPPMSINDYRQRAEECDRLAASATSSHLREAMLYIVLRWRVLANEQEAKVRTASPPRSPVQHPPAPA